MEAGIIGLAGTGRTTVFRALLAHRAPGGAVGSIHIQDPRLDELTARFKPKKSVPIEIRLHDLCPSLEPSFQTSEVEAMKRMDVLLGVIPAFSDPSEEAILSSLRSLLAELCLEDLTAVERRLKRASRDKLEPTEQEALEIAQTSLEAEKPVLAADLTDLQRLALRGYSLVTDRPLIAVLNTGEDLAGQAPPDSFVKLAVEAGVPVLALCAALEAEMADLPEEDRTEFLAEFGITAPAGAAVTRAILDIGDTIPFFTVGEDECRAWPIARGTTAREAAAKIHSDIARGFIRAEVISFEEFEPLAGGLTEAKKTGKLRLEGKEYIVKDGDIVHYRFNI